MSNNHKNKSDNAKSQPKTNGHNTKKHQKNDSNHEHKTNKDIINKMSDLLDLVQSSNCLVDVREGLQTFLIYLSNIIKHPLELKYRKIRVGNANYQVRLGHLKHGQLLLECIGYKLNSNKFLILPSSLYTSSTDLYVIKKIRDLSVYKLEQITAKFRLVPRENELASHKWSCCKHVVEAHTIGRRPTMEDDHILIDNYCNKSYLGFFGLFDGHGGRATVDFLTCSLYLNLKHYLLLNPLYSSSMKRVFEDIYNITDKQIHRQQIYQSGATSVTLLLDSKNKQFTIANCGDTRGVLCRSGKAIRLTKDHKADDLEEATMIRKRGGTIGRLKRVNGLLAVTRAFGDHLLKPPITVKPKCNTIKYNEMNDYFICIACDGVWDVLSDEEVINYIYTQILKKSNCKSYNNVKQKDLQKYLHQICLDIIKNALDRRSQDNISCMIIAL